MNSYNGFSPNERTKALRWLRAEYAAGRRTPPIVCEVCTQAEGIIEAHSEDYSEPFGPHIGAHGLCYRCHMMLHCRFKNREAWEVYKAHIREGRVFAPLRTRNFYAVLAHIRTMGAAVPYRQREPEAWTFLDTLLTLPPHPLLAVDAKGKTLGPLP